MYKFECKYCLYKTNLKGDFKRHLKSQKHQRNITNYEQNNVSEEKKKESTQKVHKSRKKGSNFGKKRYTNGTQTVHK